QYDFEAALDRVAELEPAEQPEAKPAVRVGVFGGSIALQFAIGGIDWFEAHAELDQTAASADLGCGLITEGVRMQRRDPHTGEPELYPPPESCRRWPLEWPE